MYDEHTKQTLETILQAFNQIEIQQIAAYSMALLYNVTVREFEVSFIYNVYTTVYYIHNDALVSNSLFCGLNSRWQQLVIGLSCRDGAGLCLVVLKRWTVPSPWQRY